MFWPITRDSSPLRVAPENSAHRVHLGITVTECGSNLALSWEETGGKDGGGGTKRSKQRSGKPPTTLSYRSKRRFSERERSIRQTDRILSALLSVQRAVTLTNPSDNIGSGARVSTMSGQLGTSTFSDVVYEKALTS